MSDRPKKTRTPRADPLPDPRLAPIAPTPGEREIPPRLAAMKALGGVGTLGLEVALSIMLGLFGGQWLDGRLGTAPWLTLLGFGFGLAAAIRFILRQMRIMKREAAKEEAAEGNPDPLWESDADRALRLREEQRDKASRDDAPPSAADGTKGEP